MKKLLTIAALASVATSGQAEVGGFVGLSYAFGSNNGLGFTAQMTSSRDENKGFAAAGMSYYPKSKSFGLPVGIGYQGSDLGGTVNYDLLLKKVTVAVGATNAEEKSSPAPAPAPAPL